jgi:hypothetical protein
MILDPATKKPVYSVCKKLDFELEVAFLVFFNIVILDGYRK